MHRPSFFKRTYLINPPLQLKYAFMIGGVLMVMLLLVEFHTYITIQSLMPHLFSSLLGRQVKVLQYWMLVNGLVYVAGAAFLSIFISHKIAGPIHRLEQAIQEVLESGDPRLRITLRKNDEFHALADKINLLLERLSRTRRG